MLEKKLKDFQSQLRNRLLRRISNMRMGAKLSFDFFVGGKNQKNPFYIRMDFFDFSNDPFDHCIIAEGYLAEIRVFQNKEFHLNFFNHREVIFSLFELKC